MANQSTLKWHGDKFLRKMDKDYPKFLRDSGDAVEESAKSKAPVKTGELGASIRNEVDEGAKEVFVGSDLDYALYLEYGTRKMQAQPYLRPALYETDVENILKNAFKDMQ